MSMIRTQNKVPYVYVDKSRDFQILCRAYDLTYNQIKHSIDSMRYILSSKECNDSVLPLLSTKLGFDYYQNLEGDALRAVLDGFPSAVKYKGSLLGIKRAINIWLKALHLETVVYIDVFNVLGGTYNLVESSNRKIGGYIGQTPIPTYTIAIGVGGQPRDYSLLEDILKYIKPTGYSLYFYFFSEFSTEQTPVLHASEDKASLVLVSDSVNSVVRGGELNNDDISHNTLSITEAEHLVSQNRYTYVDGDEMGNNEPTVGRVIGAVMSVEMIGSAPQGSDAGDEGGRAAGEGEGLLEVKTSFKNGAYEESE